MDTNGTHRTAERPFLAPPDPLSRSRKVRLVEPSELEEIGSVTLFSLSNRGCWEDRPAEIGACAAPDLLNLWGLMGSLLSPLCSAVSES
jgi:hypothetical protein